MKVKVYNNFAVINDVSYPDFYNLRDNFKIEYVAFKKKHGRNERSVRTEYCCTYNPIAKTICFPCGFVDILPEVEIINCENIDLTYERKEIDLSNLVNYLYSFQEDAVAISKKERRGIFLHPTGSGKTITMLKIIVDKGLPQTLLIVPNLILLNQTYEFFKSKLGNEIVGKLGEGFWDYKRVNIATIQTLWTIKGTDRADTIKKDTQMLMLDECHHVALNKKWSFKTHFLANTWFIIASAIEAPYRYGFTATLGDKNAQFLLHGITGKVIHHISLKDLIKSNVLVSANIIIYKVLFPEIYNNDWLSSYDKLISNEERNNLIAKIADNYRRDGKRVLIITNRIKKQGKVINELITNSVFLSGFTKSKDRTKAIKDFKEEENSILIGTIFGEGVDIPQIDVVIIATGGTSKRSLIQKIGRGLRTSFGKKDVIIIDFYDKDNGILECHSKRRISFYKEEPSFTLEIK